MTERTVGTVAIHNQIADDIRARIAAGEFAPGDKLPSIRQLQEQWGCSDGPVREAFAVLLGEGRISVGRGAPARVRIPSVRLKISPENAQEQKNLALRSEDERRETGASELSGGVRINETEFTASYERIPATADLAREFGVQEGTELLQRSYTTVHKETGNLILSSVSYIPVALIEANPDLLDEKNEPWPGGHWHQLYTVGIEIDRLDNSVIAIQPTTRQRQDWGMDAGVPLLCLRSRSVDTDGNVVEVADSTYPADRTEISYSHKLKRWKNRP